MSSSQKAARPLTRCVQTLRTSRQSGRAIRTFTTTPRANKEQEVSTETPEEPTVSATSPIQYKQEELTEEPKIKTVFKPWFNPKISEADRQASLPANADAKTKRLIPWTVTNPQLERRMTRQGVQPIGSRRLRAAFRSTDNIPFEQLPYQCFQEALKVLKADREEKLKLIQTERLRISNLVATDASTISGGEEQKERRLKNMRKHLEDLKIQADINDPLIKKRFEDGIGDMSKPIYRHLAEKKWRQYDYKLITQRIHQFGIVPDVLPHFEPTVDVRLAFNSRRVQPGEFIDSRVSEPPVNLKLQLFDKGFRHLTVVVLDSDVPLADKDSFTSRCHFMAINVFRDPTKPHIGLKHRHDSQIIMPWLPPFAQKGSPYHRYSVWVLEQPNGHMKQDEIKEMLSKGRDGFSLRAFTQKTGCKPVGFNMFRSTWDEGTAGVMARWGIPGADIEFKRKKVVAIKPKEKARGWEAKHKKDKYKPLGIRWSG